MTFTAILIVILLEVIFYLVLPKKSFVKVERIFLSIAFVFLFFFSIHDIKHGYFVLANVMFSIFAVVGLIALIFMKIDEDLIKEHEEKQRRLPYLRTKYVRSDLLQNILNTIIITMIVCVLVAIVSIIYELL